MHTGKVIIVVITGFPSAAISELVSVHSQSFAHAVPFHSSPA